MPSRLNQILRAAIFLCLLSFASEQALKAYADPGSGAMFVQILISGVIGSLFKMRRFATWFRSRPKRAASSGD